MSRIGIKPVQVPQGVKVTVGPDLVTVEGPKGKLSQSYIPEVVIKVEGGAVHVTRKSDTKQARAYHGLYRNLVNNMVIGVSAGFTRALLINGVGYKAEIQGKAPHAQPRILHRLRRGDPRRPLGRGRG